MTDAQSRAIAKYRKEKVKCFNVKFFPADADVYEYFKDVEGKNKYMKDLIRRDMEAEKRV